MVHLLEWHEQAVTVKVTVKCVIESVWVERELRRFIVGKITEPMQRDFCNRSII